MTNERKKHILWFLFFCFLLFAITAFASGCACKDQSIVGIKVMVEDQEITEVTKVVKVQGKTNFDLTQAIKVYSIHTNGEEKPVLSKNENGKGFEIVASLPNPLTAGAYDLVVKYEDYGSVKFRLVIEMGLNQIKNVSNLSKPYDGLPVASPTFDLDFEQETRIEYFINTGYTLMPLTSAPTNAGNYFVKITALANNFAVQSVFNSAFVISKITPIEVTSHPSFNLEYSSTRTLADLTLNPGYSWINASETPTAQKNRYEALYNPDPINYNNLITNVTVNTSKIVVDVPNPNLDYTYNGEIQTFDIAENPAYEITNNTRKDAGYQQVTVSLKDNQNFIWSSLSANDLIFTFEIKKQTPILPEIKTIYANAYDSFSDIDLPQGFSWNKENGENVGKLGNKTFFATFTPTDTTNYETIEGIEINIVVTSVVRIPKQADEILEFNGDEQSLTLENLDKELVEISGTTKATLSGEYTLVASLKYPDLTMWTDGTTENKTIKWAINKIQIELIARTDGSYSSENLTKSFNGNHFYYNSILTIPYGFNIPFEIIRKSTQQNITNEFLNSNLGSFEFVENENCENGYIKLFSDQTLTQTTATIGTSYAGITYALKNCANYGLGKEDKQQLIFKIPIKKAILNFSSTLYAGNANFNNALQAIEIISNNAKVYAYLSKEENQIATETTYIDGTWAWENPNTPLLESGKHTAIFYPSQNAENFETLKTQIQVDITINDGISSTIQIGDNTPTTVTRNGNVFSHLSNVANQTHTIKFTLPANTTATYSINGSYN